MKIKDILKPYNKTFASLEILPHLKRMTAEELTNPVTLSTHFCPKPINVTTHRDEYEYRQGPDGTFSRCLVRNRVSAVAVCGDLLSEF